MAGYMYEPLASKAMPWLTASLMMPVLILLKVCGTSLGRYADQR